MVSDTFCGRRTPIDLDAVLANPALQEGDERLPQTLKLWIRSDYTQKCYGKLPDGTFEGLGVQPQPHDPFYPGVVALSIKQIYKHALVYSASRQKIY